MSQITISGGIYHERCIWPTWDQIYGSGGRAAAALSGHVKHVLLKSYARADVADIFDSRVAGTYGFEFVPVESGHAISFDYFHALSTPTIRPSPAQIPCNPTIDIEDEVVLRFGMMEGCARVNAVRCVYDPQSAFLPERFGENGSKAEQLAIVANRDEMSSLGQDNDPLQAAKNLLEDGAEVIVLKQGANGAKVIDSTGVSAVPAFKTEAVWKVGSGDVFAAIFTAAWGVNGKSPTEAARLASLGVAEYVESMALPIPPLNVLAKSTRAEVKTVPGRVYLAAPFFTLGQRWVVDEARRCIRELGMDVFSPVHDIGPGPAEEVAPADIAALLKCDVLFAILDGLDSGTVFEVGYARALGKPVYVLSQTVSEEDLKMIAGSDCKVFTDLVAALHHMAWRT